MFRVISYPRPNIWWFQLFPEIGVHPNHPSSWGFPLSTIHFGSSPFMETPMITCHGSLARKLMPQSLLTRMVQSLPRCVDFRRCWPPFLDRAHDLILMVEVLDAHEKYVLTCANHCWILINHRPTCNGWLQALIVIHQLFGG